MNSSALSICANSRFSQCEFREEELSQSCCIASGAAVSSAPGGCHCPGGPMQVFEMKSLNHNLTQKTGQLEKEKDNFNARNKNLMRERDELQKQIGE